MTHAQCPVCEQLNNIVSRYCRSCGWPIEESTAEDADRQAVPPGWEPEPDPPRRMSATRPGFRLDPLPDLDATDDEFRPAPVRRRALGVAVSVAIVLGGGAVAGWQLGWPSVVFGGAADPAALVSPRSSPITVPLQSPVGPVRTRSSSPSKPAFRRTSPSSSKAVNPSPSTSAPASPVTSPVSSPSPVVSPSPSPVASPSPTPSPTAPP